MKTPAPVFLSACLGVALLRSVSFAQEAFVPLLDNEHKGAWEHRGTGGMQLEDGVLTTKTSGKQKGWGLYYYAAQAFTDFVLKLEFKNLEHSSNSGVFLRLADTKAEKSGYEVQIYGDDGKDQPTGSIYGVKRASPPPLRPMGQWNEMQIMVEGQKYHVALNGQVINEFTGDRREVGYIALQNHSGGTVQFRNVGIRELHKTSAPTPVIAVTQPPPSGGPSDANPLFAAVPDAAQKALSAEAKLHGGDLAGFERIDDDGDVIYAGWTTAADQTNRDFTVSADGAVLSRQVVLSELPEALQKAVGAYAVQDSVETIDRTFGDTELATYQVTVKNKEGRAREFIVDETGSLVSLELAEDQMPEEARKKLREQLGPYEIETIDRVVVDTDLTYHVGLKRADGRRRDCVVAADGALLSSRILVDEVPLEVGRAMLAHAEHGKVGRIDRVIENGEASYCFVVRHPDGLRRHWAIAADGQLLHAQVLLADLSPALRRSVREQNAAGKLFWMGKVYEPKGESFHYEVRGVREGRPYQLSMEAKEGRIIAKERQAAHEHSKKVAVAVAYGRHAALHPTHHAGGGHAGGGGGRRR